LDTGDGNFDIWGISRDYYPSHATAANSWGLRWNGDNNDFEFVGGGTSRVILDMDGGNITATGTLSASGYNKTNWDTAYGWGNHASAGYITSSGSITGDAGSVGGISASRIVYGENSTATIGISNSTLDGALKSGFYTVGTGGIPNATSVNFVLHTAYNGVGNLAGFDLACNDSTTSQFYLRPATGGGKGAWQTIVTNSGTWSISITGNAATLGGYGPNQTGGANTIVQRDSNGYIQNSYFYTSGGGSERGTGISYIAGFNSSDYYIRSYTLQGLASAMSGATMNINGSATSATNSSYTTYMSTQFLGTGSMNVSTGSCASYRNENGAGGAVTYSPLLHMAASDTMWQLQGTYGTSGNGTLYFRQGYAGSWGNWLTMLSSSNYSSYAVPTTRSITINGTSYDLSSDRSWNISTSTAWSSISAGIRENYDLQFRPADNSSSYAGLSFASPGNSQNAGYFLVRGGADSDVYTQNGLTIVADLGWLTLAQRTTAGKGVRILTGTSATTRLQVTDSETWISTYSNYKIQFAGGDQINAYNGGSAATLYLNYIGGSGGAINMAAGRFTLDTSGNGIASGSLRAPIFYDSNDTGYFLDPTASGVSLRIAGSVFSDGSFATNGYGSGGNAAVGRVYGPDGAAYSYSGGGITGAIKIRLPIRNNDTMWSMKVRIYNYSTNQTSEYLLGNYAYNQGAWNYSATYLGGVNSSALTVRFGNEGGYDCVWIGETSTSWSYPVVSVMDFMGGYSNGSVSNWYSNWDISIVSSFGTVGASVAPNINFNEVYSYSYRGNSNVAGTGSASYHPSGIYSTGTNWLYGTMYLNGNTVYDANEIHANIFYDRNDTSYYLDPNSTSRLHSLITHYTRNIHDVATDHPFGLYFSNSFSDYSYAIYRQSGAWSHPYPDLHIAFHTGIKIGAYYGYNGTRFYNNSDWATITASVNDGDNNFRGYYDIIAYASDKRLKHNIQVIDNAIDKVMKLTGMTYQWNTIGSKHGWTPDTETREAGVFAQEVQEVLPEAVKLAPFDNNMGVSKSGENFLTVKYEKIVPLLIEAIKEQQKQIEELQNKLDNVLSSR
jgi:hypothetical protein